MLTKAEKSVLAQLPQIRNTVECKAWLKCPNCGGVLKTVSGTRGQLDGSYIYRARKCLDCNKLAHTRERVDTSNYEKGLTAIKKLEKIREIVK